NRIKRAAFVRGRRDPGRAASAYRPARSAARAGGDSVQYNRVELYGAARWRPDECRLTSFLAVYHGLDASVLSRAVYVDRDIHVARRLAATAAGLRSLVIGEAQIRGQVRKALQYALTTATAGAELRRLFESAIAAGRRVRSRTGIGSGAASIP